MTLALEKDGTPVPSPNDRELTERERQVLIAYATGEDGVAGNATKSYQKIFPNSNERTASVAGSVLLNLPKAKELLVELHAQATRFAADRLVPWIELEPLAQAVIVSTLRGGLRSRLAYEAAVYVVNRCEGTPVAAHEVRIVDEARVIRAVTKFAQRMASRERVVGSPGDVDVRSPSPAVARIPSQVLPPDEGGQP